jgi:hypothetical protein
MDLAAADTPAASWAAILGHARQKKRLPKRRRPRCRRAKCRRAKRLLPRRRHLIPPSWSTPGTGRLTARRWGRMYRSLAARGKRLRVRVRSVPRRRRSSPSRPTDGRNERSMPPRRRGSNPPCVKPTCAGSAHTIPTSSTSHRLTTSCARVRSKVFALSCVGATRWDSMRLSRIRQLHGRSRQWHRPQR